FAGRRQHLSHLELFGGDHQPDAIGNMFGGVLHFRLLVTDYWLLVTDYWLLVTGYWLLVTGYW
ncbi:MAG: hypothetical protein R3220_04735, partial [Balneolaceae bacterium]|nr:hypothetical protein [Balneolaceae bacterium]